MPLNKCNCPSTYGATSLSDLASVKRSLHSLSPTLLLQSRIPLICNAPLYIGAIETLFFLAYQPQYTTFSRTQYHNTGYVHVPLGTNSINACILDAGLPACFVNFQVSCLETSQTLKKQHSEELKLFTVVTFLT